MKNLKKVLAIVVAMTMMLGTVGFAAYTDVDAEADIYTAVSTLSSLNILTGYEDGSFKPEGDITRAEFCAVVCRALGFNQEAAPTATAFSDVPAEHWASYYISTLADQKIVNGMGDGTFAPDANVTYEQAIKMLVVALGFEPMAAQKGGYPTGYLVVANTYEMTEGINAVQNAPATRGVVAQLTYNALDVPVMEQVSYGTENVWQVLDGSTYNNKESEYKTLLTKLDVAKIEGVLTETAQNGNLKKNEIEYYFHADRVYGDKNWSTFINSTFEYDEDGYRTSDWATAEFTLADYIVGAADYLQLSSIIYLREISRGKYEVIAMMPGETGSTVELGLEDIDAISLADKDQKYNAIEYYPSASSTKTNKYKLDSSVDAYYNYGTIGFAKLVEDYFVDDEGSIFANKDMEITLVENDGDSYYDAILVKEYTYDIVKAIDADRGVIEVEVGNDVKFDLDDEEVAYVILDANGEEIALENINEGDVFAYITSNGKTSKYDWIEFINLGASSVTGAVDETDAQNGLIYVNSTEYGVADVDMPNLGDEGTFFLTRTGKVFYIDTTASVSGNYAYVLNAAFTDADFTEAWQLKLLTKDNEVVVYTVRDTFTTNDGEDADDKDDEVSAKTADCDMLEAFEAQANAVTGYDEDKGAHRIITFKLDSKNRIRDIKFVNTSRQFTDKEYNADAQVLAVDLKDAAVLFNISANKADNYFATDISALVDEGKYDGYYVTNIKGDNDCVIITKGTSLIDYTQDFAIVSSVTSIKLDEGATDALKVRYYTSEDETLNTLTVVCEEDVTKLDGNTDYADLTEGAVFMFTADEEGVASAIAVLAYFTEDGYFVNEAMLDAIITADDDNSFEWGTSTDIKSVSNGKKVTFEGGFITVKGSANAYTYQNRNGKTIIHVGDWRALDVEDGEGYPFFARLYNGSVKDIITFPGYSFYGEEDEDEGDDEDVDSSVDSGADEDVDSSVDSGADDEVDSSADSSADSSVDSSLE